jgi:hypothetical protein
MRLVSGRSSIVPHALPRQWAHAPTGTDLHRPVGHGARHGDHYGRAIGLSCLSLCVGLWWKARQEERIMSRHFPDADAEYKLRVRAIIPFVL